MTLRGCHLRRPRHPKPGLQLHRKRDSLKGLVPPPPAQQAGRCRQHFYGRLKGAAFASELVAQLVEQRPFKAWVLGSNPSELTTQNQSLPARRVGILERGGGTDLTRHCAEMLGNRESASPEAHSPQHPCIRPNFSTERGAVPAANPIPHQCALRRCCAPECRRPRPTLLVPDQPGTPADASGSGVLP